MPTKLATSVATYLHCVTAGYTNAQYSAGTAACAGSVTVAARPTAKSASQTRRPRVPLTGRSFAASAAKTCLVRELFAVTGVYTPISANSSDA